MEYMCVEIMCVAEDMYDGNTCAIHTCVEIIHGNDGKEIKRKHVMEMHMEYMCVEVMCVELR